MDPTLLNALGSGDLDEAARWVEQEDDPLRVVAMYHGAVRHLYWELRDVAGVVRLAKSGIDFALGRATEGASRLHAGGKALAFDLGSFTWPGWDEPGIEISHESLDAGREAARLNLELAEQLGRDGHALHAAHWLVGAHSLATAEYEAAMRSFEAALEAADDRPDELAALGYLALTRLLDGDEDPNAELERIRDELATLGPDGVEYARQLGVARDVFSRR